MPVPEFIRQQIDNAFVTGMESPDFGDRLLRLAGSILRLPYDEATDDEIGWSFAYLEYVIADRILSTDPANANQQLQYGARMRVVLRTLYASQSAYWRLWFQSAFTGDETLRRNHEQVVFSILRSMHNVVTAFYRVAQIAGEPVPRLDIPQIEGNLQDAIGNFIYAGSVMARTIHPDDAREAYDTGDYARARLFRESDLVRIQIGARRARRRALTITEWGATTWNLDGLEAISERWEYVDRLAQATRNMRVFALQSPGTTLPAGAELVGTHNASDQFGVPHSVMEYRFQIRRHRYRMWTYNGLQRSYQLSMLTTEDFRVQYFAGVRVVADGYEPTAQEEPTHHHAMGLLFSRGQDLANTDAGVVFYTFLASTMQPEASTERVARQIAWHTDHNYAILGDFDRAPLTGTPPADWLERLEIGGRILPARSATYPSANPTSMFDYAIVNGTTEDSDGIVHAQLHDRQRHRAVQYRLMFPQGPDPLTFTPLALFPRT